VKSTNQQFRSIDIDQSNPREIIFRNPFPDKYEQLSTRRELIKAWNEDCRIREAELYEFRRNHRNRS
jgi:hypothetical protein